MSAVANIAEILAALCELDPVRKCARVAALVLPESDFSMPQLAASEIRNDKIPGRPPKPELIRPRDVPRRGFGTPAGRVALVHAVAHIEFNAVNLALDACWRFRDMPSQYYRDWLSVAQDEARHFSMLSQRLGEWGHGYGDFPAHNGLWEAAEKTAHDVLARMALVPRVLEARGLDVTPSIIEGLREAGDEETVRLLRIILDEEVRHVRIGTDWFRYCCKRRGLPPADTFKQLLAEHRMRIHPPVNRPARLLAGFGEDELPD